MIARATGSRSNGRTAGRLLVAVLALSCASPAREVTPPRCDHWVAREPGGPVQAPQLVEASGIAASRNQRGVYWSHNDSGDGARLFAMDEHGRDLGRFVLAGVRAIDIEDIAVGPAPDAPGSHVFLADIGDNPAARLHIAIHRLPEPDIARTLPGASLPVTGAISIALVYPDDESIDAEAFFIDPANGDFYIVTKRRARVFRASGSPMPPGAPARVLEEVGRLELEGGLLPPARWVTGGDISETGDRIALRTYTRALVWPRPPGSSIADALQTTPCPAPTRSEPQGEAIGFQPGGGGYVTISEGKHPPLHYFDAAPRP